MESVCDCLKDGRFISLAKEYPSCENGILIKICPKDPKYIDEVHNFTYFGYRFPDSKYIDIIYRINDDAGMAWKVLKEYDEDEIWWLGAPEPYVSNPEIERKMKAVSHYGKYVRKKDKYGK